MTLTLENVVSWLKTLDPELSGCVAAGVIDGGKDKFVGVYNDRNAVPPRLCLGGEENTRYEDKHVALLVHWTKSETQAEEKALELYDKLYCLCGVPIGDVWVISIRPSAPIPAGRDNKGIIEYVINLKICYERN